MHACVAVMIRFHMKIPASTINGNNNQKEVQSCMLARHIMHAEISIVRFEHEKDDA